MGGPKRYLGSKGGPQMMLQWGRGPCARCRTGTKASPSLTFDSFPSGNWIDHSQRLFTLFKFTRVKWLAVYWNESKLMEVSNIFTWPNKDKMLATSAKLRWNKKVGEQHCRLYFVLSFEFDQTQCKFVWQRSGLSRPFFKKKMQICHDLNEISLKCCLYLRDF